MVRAFNESDLEVRLVTQLAAPVTQVEFNVVASVVFGSDDHQGICAPCAQGLKTAKYAIFKRLVVRHRTGYACKYPCQRPRQTGLEQCTDPARDAFYIHLTAKNASVDVDVQQRPPVVVD